MHLFDLNRPKSPNGHPRFLIGDDIIPFITAYSYEDGYIRLSAMLNNYGPSRSYSYHSIDLPISALSFFFNLYTTDPEDAIKTYFNWSPQAHVRKEEELEEPEEPALTTSITDLL